MQVKKFEAPTIQEALETIKRELGPEAIILQTKKYKRGFGLMSRASVEVTAAISDRALQKKHAVESKLPEPARDTVSKLAADKQADVYDKYSEKVASRVKDNVQLSRKNGTGANAAGAPRITATRYAEIDSEEVVKKPATASAAGTQAQNLARARAAGAMPGTQTAVMGGAQMTMQDEVRHLKRMIEELKNAQETSGGGHSAGAEADALLKKGAITNPALQTAFEDLVVNGVDKRFALGLVRKAGFELGPDSAGHHDQILDQLAAEIMDSVEVLSPLNGVQPGTQPGPAVIALIGPTGVGKTTTVAKVASEAILRRNLKVGLINLDSYKVAAFDQLGTYAKILNVPFRSVGSADDLRAAIQDFHSLDLVLIDTTGRSQRDPASLKEMQAILDTVPGIQTQLVLSVTTRDNELYDMATRFSIFRPRGVIFSKLDEGSIYGAMYNLVQKIKLPLLYFTTGQRVPEDIEEATRERLAALILDL